MAQFLSDDYMTEAGAALNGHDGFKSAIANVELRLQFAVTDGPDGEFSYYLNINDGAADVALGELDGADVTVTNSYETAAAISKGELNTQMAFMTGKLKVAGNMAKLMMNQGVITKFSEALSALDVDY